MLVQSQNESLKQEYFHLSNGQILLGVGFLIICGVGDPLIVAVPATGVISYRTRALGHRIWLVSRVYCRCLPGWSGGSVCALCRNVSGCVGCNYFSQPMALAAMTSTNTVTATLTNWFYLKSASSRSSLAVGFRKR